MGARKKDRQFPRGRPLPVRAKPENSKNIQVVAVNDVGFVQLPYLVQQHVLRVRKRRRARACSMIEDQQSRSSTRCYLGQFLRGRVMLSPVRLPLVRALLESLL